MPVVELVIIFCDATKYLMTASLDGPGTFFVLGLGHMCLTKFLKKLGGMEGEGKQWSECMYERRVLKIF